MIRLITRYRLKRLYDRRVIACNALNSAAARGDTRDMHHARRRLMDVNHECLKLELRLG